MGHALTNGIGIDGLTRATLNAFNVEGIEVRDAVEAVKWPDMEHFAFVTYGLPDSPDLRQYLKGFHDNLVQKSTPQ